MNSMIYVMGSHASQSSWVQWNDKELSEKRGTNRYNLLTLEKITLTKSSFSFLCPPSPHADAGIHTQTRNYFFFFPFIFISWRLITLQYCSGFCHTLTWISHGVTCIPHPDPPSHLPLHPIPLDLPSALGPSTCLMHPTWAGDLFHSR